MPIISPQVNTNIDRFDYTSPAQQQQAEQAKLAMALGGQAARDAYQQSKEAQLKQLLQAKQQQGQQDLLKQQQAGELANKQAMQQSDLATLQKMHDQGLVENGGQAKAGELSTGADPYARMLSQQQHGSASAIQHATDQYMKGAGKLQDVAGSINEGLDAINDPKQIGSVGAARTLLIKSFGMNRYNGDEGKGLVGGNTWGSAQGLLNSLGDDNNPLQPNQRQAISNLLQSGYQTVKGKHEDLKSQVHSAYQVSPYYDQSRDAGLDKLAQPLDQRLTSMGQRFASPQAAAAPAPAATSPQPGLVDRAKQGLMNMLGLGGSQPQAASAAPISTSAPQVMKQYSKTRNQTRVSNDGGKTWQVFDGQQ